MSNILQFFWATLIETLPWFLGGAVLAAWVEKWLKPEWLAERSGRTSVIGAILAGALLPGCAMTTMPLASAFKNRGASLGALTAFIMIAPILSPHTVIMTAALLGVPITIGRILLPVVLTLIVGITINRFARSTLQPIAPTDVSKASEESKECCSCGCSCSNEQPSFWKSLFASLKSLLPFLIIGLLVASVLQALLPQDFATRYLTNGWVAYFAAAGSGIPLYVCDGGEVPLTLALLKLGVGIGPAFTFLLSSVGTCLPTIMMAPRIIGIRATYIYLVSWIVLAIGGGILMQALLSSSH